MELDAIKKLAFELMGNRNSHSWKEKGNKYYHGERVAALALKLRGIIIPEDDSHDEILTVAAWFHDIANGNEEHARIGADKVREVLAAYCSKEELNSICEIISVHDDRYTGRDTYSDVIKLHQDADLLDHIGTYDLWIHIAYSIAHDLPITESINWLHEVRPTLDEQYRGELNYEVSKRIYDEKSDFVKYCGSRFKVEGYGGIWKEDEILTSYFEEIGAN
jgi:uncharacterized protein